MFTGNDSAVPVKCLYRRIYFWNNESSISHKLFMGDMHSDWGRKSTGANYKSIYRGTDLEEKSSDRIVPYFSMGNKCCAKRFLFKEYYVNFSPI